MLKGEGHGQGEREGVVTCGPKMHSISSHYEEVRRKSASACFSEDTLSLDIAETNE